MTDAELCAKVQAGDREAAGEIQSRHARLVVHIIVKEGYPNTDRVEQAGRIGLHKAALGFRPERSRPGARRPFANYAGTSIRREMGKEVKAMGLDLRAGLIDRGGPHAPVCPSRTGEGALDSLSGGGVPSLDLLSPLPRVVCRLLLAGVDPVARLGLYPGELDIIRDRALAEVT
jgi:hypothetical protein